jgi:hypothetical protein
MHQPVSGPEEPPAMVMQTARNSTAIARLTATSTSAMRMTLPRSVTAARSL